MDNNIEDFEKTNDELEEEREIEEVREKSKEMTRASKLVLMKTFVRIPSKMPEPDPEWMQKKFRGESL